MWKLVNCAHGIRHAIRQNGISQIPGVRCLAVITKSPIPYLESQR
jgi:hypothetical protein